MKKKKLLSLSIIPLVIAIILGWWFADTSNLTASYNGLPTVPCIDPTKKIILNYTFHVAISVDNRKFPLDSSIGHDYGNCLRAMHTNDNSGVVYVVSTENEQYTLGNFFQVWHKTFNSMQFMQYRVMEPNELTVLVNGKKITTFENTFLHPKDNISIIYQ